LGGLDDTRRLVYYCRIVLPITLAKPKFGFYINGVG
jgi:hypothetical protein